MTLRSLLAGGCCMAALVAMPSLAAAQTETAPVTTQADTAIGDPVASAKLAADVGRDNTSAAGSGDVVVTGTRITRPNTRSAAPIVTTTAFDIAAQGATTIEEVVNRLPQVQVNSEQNFSDSEGRQRIKLRSLGYLRVAIGGGLPTLPAAAPPSADPRGDEAAELGFWPDPEGPEWGV